MVLLLGPNNNYLRLQKIVKHFTSEYVNNLKVSLYLQKKVQTHRKKCILFIFQLEIFMLQLYGI